MSPILLEVCTDGPDGCAAAERGGADRVELACALSEGGLTPGPGLLRASLDATDLPIVALVRPRAGDFCYSAAERDVLRRDVEFAAEAGAAAVALGALREDGEPDWDLVAELVERAAPCERVFHRAFDACRDPLASLARLGELGFARVLSSGAAPTALEGLEALRAYVDAAPDGLSVVPAGGVRVEVAARVAAGCGARELHFTARATIDGPMRHRPGGVRMGSSGPPPDEFERRPTEAGLVRAYVDALADL